MLFEFVDFADARLAAAFAGFGLPSGIFWLYFSGSILLVVGLVKILKDELPQMRGLDKVMPFGRLFLAIPLAVFGTEHRTNTADIANIVPRWFPAHEFWVYLVGVALIAAALSITVQIQSPLAATLLGAMLFSFVLLIHIPNIIAHPGNRFFWAVGLRDSAFSGGALAYAGSHGRNVPALVTVGRFFVAIPAVFVVRHTEWINIRPSNGKPAQNGIAKFMAAHVISLCKHHMEAQNVRNLLLLAYAHLLETNDIGVSATENSSNAITPQAKVETFT